MKRTKATILALAFGVVAPSAAFAADDHAGHRPGAGAKVAEVTAPKSTGEVRKVDKGAGKVTIKHGPLENLDMPAMTMVFRVKDPAMLDRVKAGDRIRFDADMIGGQVTVIKLEPAK